MDCRCTVCNCKIYRYAFVISDEIICNSCMQNNYRKTVQEIQNKESTINADKGDNNEAD